VVLARCAALGLIAADVSCGRERGDLGEVVGEDAVAAPGHGAVAAGDAATGPAVAVFEVADAALAAGSPFDQAAELAAVFVGSASRAGLAFPGIATVVTPSSCSAAST
jgi:hypothetical protein